MVDESTLIFMVILHGTTQTRCIILPFLYSCVFIHCCSLASRENPHWNHRPRCRRRRCFVSIVVLSTLATIPFLVFGIFPIVFEVARFVLLNPTCLVCLCGRPLTHRCKKKEKETQKNREENRRANTIQRKDPVKKAKNSNGKRMVNRYSKKQKRVFQNNKREKSVVSTRTFRTTTHKPTTIPQQRIRTWLRN